VALQHQWAPCSTTNRNIYRLNALMGAGAASDAQEWRSLAMPKKELCLAFTLPTGQSFRWRKTGEDTYTGVIHQRVVSSSAPLHLFMKSSVWLPMPRDGSPWPCPEKSCAWLPHSHQDSPSDGAIRRGYICWHHPPVCSKAPCLTLISESPQGHAIRVPRQSVALTKGFLMMRCSADSVKSMSDALYELWPAQVFVCLSLCSICSWPFHRPKMHGESSTSACKQERIQQAVFQAEARSSTKRAQSKHLCASLAGANEAKGGRCGV